MGAIDKRLGRATLGLCLGLALIAAGTLPARADVKDGVDAWGRGDYDAAVAQWQGPAAKGDPDAMFNMGQAYKLGRGEPKDLAKAEDFYARAAKKGHIRAADNYGILLFQTNRQAEAIPWLNASADRGEPRAMYILGIAAYNGDYLEKDPVRAYALMTRAAQTGLQQAVNSLAAMNEGIPLEQRQQGVALAQELDRKASGTRASEMGSADLGSGTPIQGITTPAPTAIQRVDLPPAQVQFPVPRTPAAPTAGADYAHPVALPAQTPAAPRKPPVIVAAMRPARPAPPAQTHAPAGASGGIWRVQLGAFGQKEHADALWAKVRGRPEIAGHPRIDAGTGVARLMAGGYSEAEAQHACGALKAAGLTCLVVNH
jgi:cell division septation protein DedD